MTFMTPLASSTNLTYALRTNPVPLQVSLVNATSTADIQLVITNQHADAVSVDEIMLTVLVGADAASLTDQTSAALTTDWSPHAEWSVQAPASPGQDKNVYTVEASDSGTGSLATGDSIVVTFVGVPINTALGTTTLSLIEKTSMGSGEAAYALAKFPYGFWFDNLTVLDPQSSAVVSQVAHGGAVRLAWDSSVTDASSYTVYYSTAQGQQKATPTTVNQWELSQVFQDTLFNVELTLDDVSGETVTHVLTTSVAVTQPDLSVTSVALAGKDLATTLATMAASLVPTGAIIMWSGKKSEIPTGWSVCDGTKGTPNLSNRFVFGADPVWPPVGLTGGQYEHSHTASASVSVASAGAHTHGMPSPWYDWEAAGPTGSPDKRTIIDRRGIAVADVQTKPAGDHVHDAAATVTVDAAKLLPPYAALYFIMKTDSEERA